MHSSFVLFGTFHLSVLALAPLAGLLLGRLARTGPAAGGLVRALLALFLLTNELVWYGYNLHQGWAQFPGNLPLQLCDLTLWATVIALLTLRRAAFELSWYPGLGGAAMAMLTPDLGWADFPSYPALYYFLSHGGVAVAALALVFGGMLRPTRGSWLRAFLYTNLFAAAMAVFNVVFDTNYLFLCQKPESFSLLDCFGPWPLYILTSEALAFGLFWLLWLPFRGKRESAT